MPTRVTTGHCRPSTAAIGASRSFCSSRAWTPRPAARPRLAAIHHQTPRRCGWRTPMVAEVALAIARLADAATSRDVVCSCSITKLSAPPRRTCATGRRARSAPCGKTVTNWHVTTLDGCLQRPGRQPPRDDPLAPRRLLARRRLLPAPEGDPAVAGAAPRRRRRRRAARLVLLGARDRRGARRARAVVAARVVLRLARLDRRRRLPERVRAARHRRPGDSRLRDRLARPRCLADDAGDGP